MALAELSHNFYGAQGRRIHYVTTGSKENPAVVLLAGFPQSWHAWHKVIPLLSGKFYIIAIDLPGQGDSDKPLDSYDTQTVASKIHEAIQFSAGQHYYLVGHDVGAWVAFTYALMYPQEITRMALLDAGIPGVTLPDKLPINPEAALRTWHFPFHTIPDLPELLIEGKERLYLEWFLRSKAANPLTFEDTDIDEYLRVFKQPGALRAGLAYYRAITTSSKANLDFLKSKKIPFDVLAISAGSGSIRDMAACLSEAAPRVTGVSLEGCGHFIPEEKPSELAVQLKEYFQ